MRDTAAALTLVLALTAGAMARPPREDGQANRATLKGDRGKFQVAGDFPRNYLAWGYQRPDPIPWLLPYWRWERKHKRYFRQTYNVSSLDFTPSMLVMHYTVIADAETTWRALNRNKVTVHYMVAKDGTVYELLPPNKRCTGAYGVNHLALSVEMVARTEDDLLSRANQVFQSFCLAKYLVARYNIPLENVVGHYEVGMGVKRVPQYLDLKDPYYPDRYPPWSKRTDPGKRYMRWLRSYLQVNPPSSADL